MDNDFSATTSGKTATATSGQSGSGINPFDQIVALEKAENERAGTEISALQAEEGKRKEEYNLQEEEADQESKGEAKDDLKKYRETELIPILKQAETDATSNCDKLNAAYEKNGKDLAKKLADQMTSSDSPLFT